MTDSDMARIKAKVLEVYRLTGGEGPEWQRVEWMLDEIIRNRPARTLLEVDA
ncbi:MAG: hypothetical protein ACREK4_03350 [Candidatus Rokuibacteriota bacterium]